MSKSDKDKTSTTIAPEPDPEFKVKDQVPEGAGVREKVCCIYDGTLESGVMIHKLVKEFDVTVLESDKVKFGKLNLQSKAINGIGELKKADKILDYIKECGKYCLSQKITKLYIPWTTEKMNTNQMYQDLFMNGVSKTLAEINEEEKGKVVRAVFYNYGRSTEDIEKNKTQYGL